ncbi:MAG: hypothetical protein AMJ43_07315 [Coxiella sp. DG_40]|nr:MAG: hypothetical protein AMJ43_07315 [Coxiella sp. DG_40]
MLKRFLRMGHYAGLLLKIGLRVFLSQLRRQLYSKDILFAAWTSTWMTTAYQLRASHLISCDRPQREIWKSS